MSTSDQILALRAKAAEQFKQQRLAESIAADFVATGDSRQAHLASCKAKAHFAEANRFTHEADSLVTAHQTKNPFA